MAVKEWSGSCDPCDPDNYWIDDETDERVNALTGERTQHVCQCVFCFGSGERKGEVCNHCGGSGNG